MEETLSRCSVVLVILVAMDFHCFWREKFLQSARYTNSYARSVSSIPLFLFGCLSLSGAVPRLGLGETCQANAHAYSGAESGWFESHLLYRWQRHNQRHRLAGQSVEFGCDRFIA